MPPSEAKKRANKKYQAKTIASLACRVKKEQADAFKVYCMEQGKTSNAVLRDYVLGCIGEQNAPEGPQEAVEAPSRAEGGFLTLSTLQAAQRAAEATGEAVRDFISRAVETQEKRDKSSLLMGIDPIAKDKAKEEG